MGFSVLSSVLHDESIHFLQPRPSVFKEAFVGGAEVVLTGTVCGDRFPVAAAAVRAVSARAVARVAVAPVAARAASVPVARAAARSARPPDAAASARADPSWPSRPRPAADAAAEASPSVEV